MAIKTRSQLNADADAKIKDNGGTDNTKTKGIDHRTLTKDQNDSAYLLKEPVLQTKTGTTILFDGCNKYVNFATATTGNLTIDPVTNGVETSIAIVTHKDTSEPTLTPFNSDVVLVKLDQSATYNPAKINMYSFHYVEKRGAKYIVTYSIVTMPVPIL